MSSISSRRVLALLRLFSFLSSVAVRELGEGLARFFFTVTAWLGEGSGAEGRGTWSVGTAACSTYKTFDTRHTVYGRSRASYHAHWAVALLPQVRESHHVSVRSNLAE
jgi:hypothetical protein